MSPVIQLTEDEMEKIENGGTVEIESFVFGPKGVNGVVEVCGPDSEEKRSKARPWVHKSD